MPNIDSKIAPQDMPFLNKIKDEANLENVYEAKDLTEVVYRTMRDLIPTDTVEGVTSELEEETFLSDKNKNSQAIADLWKDTNPLVAWLSKIRPRFKGSVPFTIDDNLFITRVEQEGGMPNKTNGETVIKAVFAATKAELSPPKIEEVSKFLPGKINQIWQQA